MSAVLGYAAIAVVGDVVMVLLIALIVCGSLYRWREYRIDERQIRQDREQWEQRERQS